MRRVICRHNVRMPYLLTCRLSVCLPACLSACLSVCLIGLLSTCLPAFLSVFRLNICLIICFLPAYLSAFCLFNCLTICFLSAVLDFLLNSYCPLRHRFHSSLRSLPAWPRFYLIVCSSVCLTFSQGYIYDRPISDILICIFYCGKYR